MTAMMGTKISSTLTVAFLRSTTMAASTTKTEVETMVGMWKAL